MIDNPSIGVSNFHSGKMTHKGKDDHLLYQNSIYDSSSKTDTIGNHKSMMKTDPSVQNV